MGLLSDPEYGSAKWIKVLTRFSRPVCLLCYIGAFIWFLLLGHRDFNNETYFSENALLPGLVTNEFAGERFAIEYYNQFVSELEDKYEDTTAIPVPWLVAKMTQLHLEVYTHNFTLNYPLGEKQTFHGTNVYGILRAARAASLEALVISVPFRPLNTHMKGTAAGVALMLAFAQFARAQKYWAKDIIFLVTEHEQLGTQAWLEAYHGITSDKETFYDSLRTFCDPSMPKLDIRRLIKVFELDDGKKCLDSGKLQGRSGSIQAAINLELHIPNIKYIEVKLEGLNGQLPNLDLVNLVHKLCVKSNIHHSYKNSYSWIRYRDKTEEWVNAIWTMLGMFSAQVAGVPNGNHGLFHRFGIEAVTLEGRDNEDPAGSPPRVKSLSPANFHRLGVTIESIMRSLNNLLERFHQSYFFYVLAGTNRFISIGQYMPALCLFVLATLVKALSLWVTIHKDDEYFIKKAKKKKIAAKLHALASGDHKKEDTSSVSKDHKKDDIDISYDLRKRKVTDVDERKTEEIVDKKEKTDINVEDNDKECDWNMTSIGTNYILVHLIGYVVMHSPDYLSHLADIYDIPSEEYIFYGLLVISLITAILTPFLPRLFRKDTINFEEMTVINILVLIELATICLSVGMHNFSLGLAIAAVYTPLALIAGVVVRNKSNFYLLFLKRFLCLLLNPLVVVTICMTAYSKCMFPEDNLMGMLSRGSDAAMQATMFAIVDSRMYNNWLFNMCTTLLFPTWILFWQLLRNKVEAPKEEI